MKKDFADREWIRQRVALARELKAQQRRYVGLENVFASIQEGMLRDLEQSALIEHSGDKGTVRENVLREFLSEKSYLPRRFGVSPGSSHILSSSGRISSQSDLVIFDADNSPRLLDRGDIQYFPLECVYGVIEVKSDLNSTDRVQEALEAVASFKRLSGDDAARTIRFSHQPSHFGFGVLFAFDASLKWPTLVDAITDWQKTRPPAEWPNMVVVLNQGILLQLQKNQAVLHTEEIAKLTEPRLLPVIADHGVLLQFYLLLMDLLTTIELPQVPLRNYASLPALVDEREVSFPLGAFSEVGICSEHGPYLRQLNPGAANRIVSTCAREEPMSMGAVLNAAYGENVVDRARQDGQQVRIYNPENHPLSQVLVMNRRVVIEGEDIGSNALAFEQLLIDGETYLVPLYYIVKHALIRGCRKCGDLEPDDFSLEDFLRSVSESKNS